MTLPIYYADKKINKTDTLINAYQPQSGATGVASGSRELAEKLQQENPKKRYIVETIRTRYSPWTGNPAGDYTVFSVYEETD